MAHFMFLVAFMGFVFFSTVLVYLASNLIRWAQNQSTCLFVT